MPPPDWKPCRVLGIDAEHIIHPCEPQGSYVSLRPRNGDWGNRDDPTWEREQWRMFIEVAKRLVSPAHDSECWLSCFGDVTDDDLTMESVIRFWPLIEQASTSLRVDSFGYESGDWNQVHFYWKATDRMLDLLPHEFGASLTHGELLILRPGKALDDYVAWIDGGGLRENNEIDRHRATLCGNSPVDRVWLVRRMLEHLEGCDRDSTLSNLVQSLFEE